MKQKSATMSGPITRLHPLFDIVHFVRLVVALFATTFLLHGTSHAAVPSAPIVLSPTEGDAVAANKEFTVSFTPVSGADQYHVQRYDRLSGAWSYSNLNVPTSACDADTCVVSVDGLAVQERALWRLRAHNTTGWSEWRTSGNFDVIGTLPVAPAALAPITGDVVAANGAIKVSFTPVNYAVQYHVQRFDRLAGEWSYSNLDVPVSVCDDEVCEVSIDGLAEQERALWRVRARNVVGWSQWRTSGNFDVLGTLPVAPVTIFPVAGDAVAANKGIKVRFTPVDNAIQYHVQRYDRLALAWNYSNLNVPISSCDEELCEFTVARVAKQEKALWRVRARNVAGWSQWSMSASFDVLGLPRSPLVQYPDTGDVVAANKAIKVSFIPVSGADQYHVQRFDRLAGQWSYSNLDIPSSSCNKDLCEVSVDGLAEQERALWRVRARNVAGWSQWRTSGTFNVLGTVPVAPIALFPITGDVVAANKGIKVRFTPVNSAEQYHLQRYDRLVGQWSYSKLDVPVSACDEEVCEYSVARLAKQENALWRVRARNVAGWSDWSTTASFDVLGIPRPPVVQLPTTGIAVAENKPFPVSFSPVTGAYQYHVQRFDRLAGEWSYSNLTITGSSCNDEVCEVTVTGLNKQEKALWRVRARNVAGWSQWRTSGTFNVVGIPSTPLVLSPVDGAAVAENKGIKVRFAAVSSAEQYHVQRFDRLISKWSYSNLNVPASNCNQEVCEVTVDGVAEQERALWRVRARNVAGWSPWSESASFDSVGVPSMPDVRFPSTGDFVAADKEFKVGFTPVAKADQYHVERFDRLIGEWSFSNASIPASGCNEELCEVTVDGVAEQNRVLWRVRAGNVAGWSKWKISGTFGAVGKPSAPLVLSPTSGDRVLPDRGIVVQFAPVVTADRYHVQRYDRLAGEWSYSDSAVETSNCDDEVCSVAVDGVEEQENAIWRVRARNVAGWSSWTNSGTFDVFRPPVISEFASSSPEIDEGQSATLSWIVRNADSITITPEVNGGQPLPVTGQVQISPAQTTTYRLETYKFGEVYSKKTVTVSVRANATVSIVADVTEGPAPLTVRFTPIVQSSTAINRFCWEFEGDGGPVNVRLGCADSGFDRVQTNLGLRNFDLVGQDIVHTYSKPGVYPVTVLVTDAEGNQEQAQININVGQLDVEPIVSAFANRSVGGIPLTVTFSLDISPLEIFNRIQWDFDGNGTIDLDQDPNTRSSYSFTYNETGVYRPEFTLADNAGKSTDYRPASLRIVSTGSAIPGFTLAINPRVGLAPMSPSFSIGNTFRFPTGSKVESFEWDFNGDGELDLTGSSTFVRWTYPESIIGIVPGTVTAITENGARLTHRFEVVVNPSVAMEVTPTVKPGSGRATVNVTTSSDLEFELSVVSSSGKFVKSLLPKRFRSAGEYTAFWNGKNTAGKNQPAGVYHVVAQGVVDGETIEIAINGEAGGEVFYPTESGSCGTSTISSKCGRLTISNGPLQPFNKLPKTYDLVTERNARVTAYITQVGSVGTPTSFFRSRLMTPGEFSLQWYGTGTDGKILEPYSRGYVPAVYGVTLGDNSIVIEGLDTSLDNLLITPDVYHPFEGDRTGTLSQIQFSLSHDADVTLSIDNMSKGINVFKKTYSGFKSGSNRELTWDGKDNFGRFVGPGGYIFTVTTIDEEGGSTITRKAVQNVEY